MILNIKKPVTGRELIWGTITGNSVILFLFHISLIYVKLRNNIFTSYDLYHVLKINSLIQVYFRWDLFLC